MANILLIFALWLLVLSHLQCYNKHFHAVIFFSQENICSTIICNSIKAIADYTETVQFHHNQFLLKSTKQNFFFTVYFPYSVSCSWASYNFFFLFFFILDSYNKFITSIFIKKWHFSVIRKEKQVFKHWLRFVFLSLCGAYFLSF